jgi:RimJ/RimL family protein N-acetyltransferase
MIDPDHQGRGFGSRAVRLALEFAFCEAGVHRVWHGVVSGNEPVMRFFRRLGFIEEGRAREARLVDGRWYDHVYFSTLEQEWQELSRVAS